MPTMWEELVSVALLGTEQLKMPALSGEGKLSEVVAKLFASADRNKEAKLLAATGLIALHRRSGTLPFKLSTQDILTPKLEPLKFCTIGLIQAKLLIENYPDTLLPLWLNALARAQRRLPPATIPYFLQFAFTKNYLRTEVSEVVGETGYWLAALNPNWSFAIQSKNEVADDKNLPDLFETGSPRERVYALEMLRKRKPALALELLKVTWAAESPTQKHDFINVLKDNPTIADEPFLEETALEDKRKEIRDQALRLLAIIPESRFCKRMHSRVIPLIGARGNELDVSYPGECDKSMIRDGLTKGGTTISAQDKFRWLFQMVSVVEPGVWESRLKMSPDQILNGISFDDQQKQFIVQGFGAAAILHQDKKWITAFVGSRFSPMVANQIENLRSASLREGIILKMIELNNGALFSPHNEYQQPIINALMSVKHQWSDDFSRALIPRIIDSTKNTTSFAVKQLINETGPFFPLSLRAELETACTAAGAATEQFMEPFLSILKFKDEIYSTLRD